MPESSQTLAPDPSLTPTESAERRPWQSVVVPATTLAFSLLAVLLLLGLLRFVDAQYPAEVQALGPAGTTLAVSMVVVAVLWTFREILRVRRFLESLAAEQSGLRRSQDYLR